MSEVVAAMAAAESVKEVMGVVDKKKARSAPRNAYAQARPCPQLTSHPVVPSTTYSCCFPHDDGSEEAGQLPFPAHPPRPALTVHLVRAEKGQVPLPVPADDKIIKFPFQLDSFQEMAIACLHRGQSVCACNSSL